MKNKSMVLKCPHCKNEIFLQDSTKKNACPVCGKDILTINMKAVDLLVEIYKKK